MAYDEPPEAYQIKYFCSYCRRWLWSDTRLYLREYEEDDEGQKICHECIERLARENERWQLKNK